MNSTLAFIMQEVCIAFVQDSGNQSGPLPCIHAKLATGFARLAQS